VNLTCVDKWTCLHLEPKICLFCSLNSKRLVSALSDCPCDTGVNFNIMNGCFFFSSGSTAGWTNCQSQEV